MNDYVVVPGPSGLVVVEMHRPSIFLYILNTTLYKQQEETRMWGDSRAKKAFNLESNNKNSAVARVNLPLCPRRSSRLEGVRSREQEAPRHQPPPTSVG